jgi:hypothetical protein
MVRMASLQISMPFRRLFIIACYLPLRFSRKGLMATLMPINVLCAACGNSLCRALCLPLLPGLRAFRQKTSEESNASPYSSISARRSWAFHG